MRLIESVLANTLQANQWQRKFIEMVLELLLMVPVVTQIISPAISQFILGVVADNFSHY